MLTLTLQMAVPAWTSAKTKAAAVDPTYEPVHKCRE